MLVASIWPGSRTWDTRTASGAGRRAGEPTGTQGHFHNFVSTVLQSLLHSFRCQRCEDRQKSTQECSSRAEPGAPGEPESQAPCTHLHGELHWDMVTLPAGPGLVL